MAKISCSLCGNLVEGRSLASPQKLENRIIDLIRQERPDWEAKRGICQNCLEQYRAKKFIGYLEAEYQKLSELEHAVVSKVTRRGRVSKLVHQDLDTQMTFGERVADRVAQFGGSWGFIGLFGAILLAWMAVNTWVLARHPFDPYPFILLNLVLSTLAALQAPVIMMSQNRQAHKDRMQANQDYEINLMAEIEIRDLHDKLDSLRFKQWHELWHIQKRQIAARAPLRERCQPGIEGAAALPVRAAGALARVFPINRIDATALVALRVFHSLGNDGTARTSGTDEVGLAHNAPRGGPLAADLEVAFWDTNLDVMDVDHHVVFLRILDDAIPGAAPESLPFGAIATTACPPDVSHASLAQVLEWQLVARRDTSCPRM